MSITSVYKEVEKLEPSYTAGLAATENSLMVPKKVRYGIDPAIQLLDTYPKEVKSTQINKYVHIIVAALFTIVKR